MRDQEARFKAMLQDLLLPGMILAESEVSSKALRWFLSFQVVKDH